MQKINILCIGDIIGSPGRAFLNDNLATIKKEHNIHFTVVNVENSAGGFGFTRKIEAELKALNINAFTSGNHIFQQKEIMGYFDELNSLVRPLNYPEDVPGKGYRIFRVNDLKIAVVNSIGRVFMGDFDCPFRAIKKVLADIQKETPIILVDFHAEATSEKNAFGWFLDGKVSLVYGTHTHVMTADDRILNKGTAYISDVGMVRPKDGIIGMKKEPIIHKFLTQLPSKFEIPKDQETLFNAIKCSIDTKSGKAISIEKIIIGQN